MKTIIVGTAGHVDHGKSSLLKAMTGGAVDRLPEERRRGITVELGFPVMKTDGVTVFFIDVPGHETLVRNMITGVCGLGGALFAIDAKEGPRPQTEEHAFILKACGIKNITAAITKCDAADKETVKKTAEEASVFFRRWGFDARIFKASVYDEESIRRLRRAVAETKQPEYGQGPFKMYIDRAFTIKGAGTVITGSVLRGTAEENGEIFIWPMNKTVRIKRIESAGEKVRKAGPCMRAALNLAGVEVKEIKKGGAAFAPGTCEPASKYGMEIIYVPGRESSLKDNKIYNVFMGTAKNRGRLLLKSGGIILERPFPAEDGEVFFIRGGSPETTIAAGKLYKMKEKEKKTGKKYIKKETAVYKTPRHAEKIEKILKESEKPLSKNTMVQKAGLTDKETETAIKYLLNEEKIITLEKYFITRGLFDVYVGKVKAVIKEKGYADIASAKEISGLSRGCCAALLDKGDRLLLWKNRNGRRY